MVKTNYVIATWTGPRRRGNEPHCKDNVYYVKEHLRLLEKYKHDLDQITVVVPHYDRESQEIKDYFASIDGAKCQRSTIKVLRRENKGHSYGSYSHVFDLYRNDFDYYFFIEDDYVFVQDYFDRTMIDCFNSKPNCGFLCCLVTLFEERPHAAISNGIASKEVLSKIFDAKGELPSSKFSTTYHCQSQLQFSWAFLDVGFRLYDFTGTHSVVFNNVGKSELYGRGKPLMLPLQFKNRHKELS